MNQFLSDKFKFYSFLSMLLLVFVHGYNLHETYLQPWMTVNEPMTVTTFTEHWLANGLFRFRIPMLFIISGFLYAYTDAKPYKERTLKRLKTLGIPYLLWSSLALLLTFALEYIPSVNQAIKASMIAMTDMNTLTVHDYKWYEWFGRVLYPIAFQLWFIRVLLLYNIAYPAIRWCVLNIPKTWLIFTFILYFFGVYLFFIEGAGLFFFSLGIWIQKNKFDIETPPKFLPAKWFIAFFVLISLVKTYLAFHGLALLGADTGLVIGILYRLNELCGLVGLWYGADGLVRWASRLQFIRFAQPFSFMIYAFHVPVLYYAMHFCSLQIGHWPYHRLIAYVFVPIFIILISIGIGAFLRKIWPSFYGLLTGGRGL